MLIAKHHTNQPGVGKYSSADAAALIGTSAPQLQRWLDDPGLISQRLFPEDKVLAFAELIELLAVQRLECAGIRLDRIRELSELHSEQLRTNYPLSNQGFLQDCREKAPRALLSQLDFSSTGEAVRYWPRERNGLIVLDPQRRLGQPLVADSGVPTKAIAAAVQAGSGQELPAIAAAFEIPLTAVQAAMKFEQSLTRQPALR